MKKYKFAGMAVWIACIVSWIIAGIQEETQTQTAATELTTNETKQEAENDMRIVNLSIELTDEQYAALRRRTARVGKALDGDWTIYKEIEFTAAAAVHSMAEEEIRREIRAIENAQLEYITDDTPILVTPSHKEAGGKSTLSDDPKGEPEAADDNENLFMQDNITTDTSGLPMCRDQEEPQEQTQPPVAQTPEPPEEQTAQPPAEQTEQPPAAGGKLTPRGGVYMGPSGKETWYNLPMGYVVKIMRDHGFSEEEYPYSIREDGCKMLGAYIMIAANLDLRPRGTIVETSLGLGIVCDTGAFCQKDTTAIDIAVNW